MKYIVFSQHIRKSEEFSNIRAAVNILMDYNGEMTFAAEYDRTHKEADGDVPRTAKELKEKNKRQYFLQMKKHIQNEAAKLTETLEKTKPGEVIRYHLCEIKVQEDDGNSCAFGIGGGCCNPPDAL